MTWLVLIVVAAGAQQQPTPHTLEFDAAAAGQPAKIEDAAWIAGHWRGEGFGGIVEEVWAPPGGGAMMGMFRLVKQDAPVFYELFLIVPDGNSLVLKLKHFHANLAGWEERAGEAAVRFRLVKATPTAVYFEGLTYEKVDRDTLTIYLALHPKDDPVREEKFTMRRVRD